MISGFISKTANVFWNILGSTYWIQSIRKNDTRNFCLFIYFQGYNDKNKISFSQTAVKTQHDLFANEPSLGKILVSFFRSNIPQYIEKNPVEKLCKVLEMELKTYTPLGSKFVFEKIKFKVLHYIHHDFIRQRLGLSKDQARTFKSFVIN